MNRKLPFAEDVNYWKTGTRKQADAIIDEACAMVEALGGRIHQRIFGRVGDNEGYRIQFDLCGNTYVIEWPVLKSKRGDGEEVVATRRQAASFIFHDIKAKCSTAKVLGVERAFFEHVCLPDGRQASLVALPDLAKQMPRLEVRGDDG